MGGSTIARVYSTKHSQLETILTQTDSSESFTCRLVSTPSTSRHRVSSVAMSAVAAGAGAADFHRARHVADRSGNAARPSSSGGRPVCTAVAVTHSCQHELSVELRVVVRHGFALVVLCIPPPGRRDILRCGITKLRRDASVVWRAIGLESHGEPY